MFECLRADAAEVAVASGLIVKHFDVIKDISSGKIARFVDSFFDWFFL